MAIEDLGTALRDAERQAPTPPADLAGIRARGRRRRWRLRSAVAGASASALAVVALAVVGATDRWGGGDGGGVDVGVAHEPGADTLSRYERRVLRAVPGSYAVGGVVVVPGPLDASKDAAGMLHQFKPHDLPSPIVPLGRDGFTQPGYLSTSTRYPRFMQRNLPKHSQVVADTGPVSLTCALWDGHRPCGVSLLVGSAAQGWYYLYGIGSDSFLKPHASMEVFLEDTYDGRVLRQSVIGGFDGTTATRVELTLTDGSSEDASLDSGRISRGDTLFWANVEGDLASVTAYDDAGDVVARHQVRACSDPVDCEVR
jgi:hypothetical protein